MPTYRVWAKYRESWQWAESSAVVDSFDKALAWLDRIHEKAAIVYQYTVMKLDG